MLSIFYFISSLAIKFICFKTKKTFGLILTTLARHLPSFTVKYGFITLFKSLLKIIKFIKEEVLSKSGESELSRITKLINVLGKLREPSKIVNIPLLQNIPTSLIIEFSTIVLPFLGKAIIPDIESGGKIATLLKLMKILSFGVLITGFFRTIYYILKLCFGFLGLISLDLLPSLPDLKQYSVSLLNYLQSYSFPNISIFPVKPVEPISQLPTLSDLVNTSIPLRQGEVNTYLPSQWTSKQVKYASVFGVISMIILVTTYLS